MARKRQSRPSGGTAPASRGSKRQRRRPAGGAGANAGAGAAGGSFEGATSDSGASSELRIHVMRHGNVHNPKEVYYGRLPRFHLSALGRKQAVEGAERLASVITDPSELQGVFVSPMLRARQTAKEVVKRHHRRQGARAVATHAKVYPNLSEINTPGDGLEIPYLNKVGWEMLYHYSTMINGHVKNGTPLDEKASELLEIAKTRFGGLKELAAKPFEEFPDVVARIRGVIDDLRSKFTSGHVVAVAHGDVLLSSRMIARGLPATLEARTKYRPELYLPTASIITLLVSPDGRVTEESVWSPSSK